MNEGGQSSTGQVRYHVREKSGGLAHPWQLIDFMITTHPAYSRLVEQGKTSGKSIYEILGQRLETMMAEKKAETLSQSGSLADVPCR